MLSTFKCKINYSIDDFHAFILDKCRVLVPYGLKIRLSIWIRFTLPNELRNWSKKFISHSRIPHDMSTPAKEIIYWGIHWQWLGFLLIIWLVLLTSCFEKTGEKKELTTASQFIAFSIHLLSFPLWINIKYNK